LERKKKLENIEKELKVSKHGERKEREREDRDAKT
jgi:hypothetical protein